MGLGESLVRTLMFVFNGLVFLLGIGLIIIGGVVIASDSIDKLNEALPVGEDYSNLTHAGGAILAFGVIVAVVSFLGCCGAISRNKCMLYSFAVLMSIFVLAQIVVGIVAFVFRGEAEEFIRDGLLQSLRQTNNTNSTGYGGWSDLQLFAGCCGVNNYSDWVTEPGTPFSGSEPSAYPDSCCRSPAPDCGRDDPPAQRLNTRGCFTVVHDAIAQFGLMIGLGAILFALLQVLGIVFACCLGQVAD